MSSQNAPNETQYENMPSTRVGPSDQSSRNPTDTQTENTQYEELRPG